MYVRVRCFKQFLWFPSFEVLFVKILNAKMNIDENKEFLVNRLRETIIQFCTNYIKCNFNLKLEGCLIVTSDDERFLVIKLDEVFSQNPSSVPQGSRSKTTSRTSYIQKVNSSARVGRGGAGKTRPRMPSVPRRPKKRY